MKLTAKDGYGIGEEVTVTYDNGVSLPGTVTAIMMERRPIEPYETQIWLRVRLSTGLDEWILKEDE